MKVLLSLVCLVAVSCCSSPACLIQEKVADVATSVIVDKLQCRNSKEVLSSINGLLAPLGLCQQKTGAIADIACPMITKSVVDYLAANAIPEKWGCSAANAKAVVGAALLEACKKVPVDM